MNWFAINGWRLLIALALLGLWEGLSGPIFDPFWLSRPSDVALFLWKSILSGQLISDLSITFQATAIGYVFGAILGLAFGLALAQSETVALVLKPFILAIYGIPRIALAPMFILWFGIALASKVMMAAMMTFMLVFFNTYEGVRTADLELRSVARVLGASRWRLFFYVTIPNASPWIIAGLRISIPQALVAAVVAEFIASTGGLGYRIMETTSGLNTAGTMAGIVVLMVVVMVLNGLLDRLEKKALRWRPKESDTKNV
ncbi:MAG TPA: ABC transporter permease [Acidiferrobacterales bacterium]|nr:ABC transporter permease [Acidiferrobacterales bacterium]